MTSVGSLTVWLGKQSRWLLAALLVPVLLGAGCGGVTSDALTLRITVRANGLSATDRARARFLVLTVSGPGLTADGGPMVNQPAALAAGELSDGETDFFYRTTVKTGGLTFHVTLQDAAHQTIAAGNATSDPQSPIVIVELAGATVDGGTPDAGEPDSGTPDGGTPDAAPDGAGATCGNGIVDGNELCDGNCPTDCPTVACQQRALMGSAATCDARCVNAATIAMCANADGCCPPTCNANNDSDCRASCGNGVVEANELCDGACPTSCPALGCQLRTLSGAPATCNAQCATGATITACANNDGCCPPGCTAANDNNCSAACGDGVLQAPELCDGTCPTACPAQGCQLRALSGSAATCNAQCVNGGTVTGCASNDGCCPAGCNANNDNNCTPSCGNGIIETGELCDGNCPTACPQMGCQLYSLAGTACTRACAAAGTQTQCVAAADGCCPAGCSASNDADCVPTPPANDKCDKATDITAGGRFAIDFGDATQDAKAACGAEGPDVFFTFTVSGDEWIYLDVLDAKAIDATVNATLELYPDTCPPQVRALDCETSAAGEKRCARAPFPLLVVTPKEGPLGGKALPAGRYFVAVRALDKPTSWVLDYHHVPIGCASVQLTPTATTQTEVSTTCQRTDLVTPSCAPAQGVDASYLVVKCPSTLLGFSTCNGGTATAASLSAVYGSETRAAASGRCMPSTGAEAACGAPDSAAACTDTKSAALINVTNLGAGLVTVTVDTATCNSYGLAYAQSVAKTAQ
jgi:hypothetical protein